MVGNLLNIQYFDTIFTIKNQIFVLGDILFLKIP